MAKRAGKKSITKKVKTTKKAKAKTVKKAKVQKAPTPTYLAESRTIEIPAHQVAEILAMLEQRGQGAKFRRQAKKAGLMVTAGTKTVNFVKDFIAKNGMHQHRIGKAAVNSDGSFNCG